MSYDHAWEIFYKAMPCLASPDSSIQDRLLWAWQSQLIVLRIEELPEDLQAEFQKLHDELTSVEPAADEGTLQATIKRLSDEKAFEYVKRVIDMYDSIARREGAAEG